jgi:hypothetical protein
MTGRKYYGSSEQVVKEQNKLSSSNFSTLQSSPMHRYAVPTIHCERRRQRDKSTLGSFFLYTGVTMNFNCSQVRS